MFYNNNNNNNNNNKIFLIFHIILNIYIWKIIKTVYSIDVVIRNTEESILSLESILHSNSNYNEGLNIYFPDPYYPLGIYEVWSVSIPMDNSIAFISTSENSTIFDYGETTRFLFNINFDNKKNSLIRFSGIIFKHSSTSNIIYILSHHDEYNVVFDNCEFTNNRSNLVTIYSYININNINSYDYYQLEFNNCKFM